MIDLTKPFEIYDNRCKVMTTIKSEDCNLMYHDLEVCLVKFENEYILLDLNSGGCLTENFMFWKVKNV